MDNLLDMALYDHKSNTICQSPLCENSECSTKTMFWVTIWIRYVLFFRYYLIFIMYSAKITSSKLTLSTFKIGLQYFNILTLQITSTRTQEQKLRTDMDFSKGTLSKRKNSSNIYSATGKKTMQFIFCSQTGNFAIWGHRLLVHAQQHWSVRNWEG